MRVGLGGGGSGECGVRREGEGGEGAEEAISRPRSATRAMNRGGGWEAELIVEGTREQAAQPVVRCEAERESGRRWRGRGADGRGGRVTHCRVGFTPLLK